MASGTRDSGFAHQAALRPSSSLRILHVVPSLATTYGGPSRVVAKLAQRSLDHGVDVDIATTHARDEVGVFDAESSVHDPEVHSFPRVGPPGFGFAPALRSWLAQTIRSYDLLHIHGVFSYSTLVASRCAHDAAIPYLVAPHGMLEPWAMRVSTWKKKPYMWAIERSNLGRAAALHLLTKEEERNIRAIGLHTPAFVAPNGVDLADFDDMPPNAALARRYPQLQGNDVVTFLGRLDAKKGLDILIEAHARICRERPDLSVQLVIAGPDSRGYRRTIERRVTELGIESRVVFTGEVLRAEKLVVLGGSSIFALPSRSEGFSVTVVEALAAGLPVIITKGCNFPEATDAGAGLMVELNPQDLAVAICRLLDDPASRRRMGSQGHSLVKEHFTWSRITERLIQVYGDTLSGARRADAWLR